MSIVFQTSFDHYTTITHRFNSISGSPVIHASAGRNSTSGLRFTSSYNASITLPSNLTDIYVGFGFRCAALPIATNRIILLYLNDAGTTQLTLQLLPNGQLAVYGSTSILLGTLSSFSVLPNVFYHIELYARISNTVGLLQARVNEVEKLNLTGQDTQQSTNSYVTDITLAAAGDFSGISPAQFDFDDLIVSNSGFIGDVQVRCFLPTGIGTTNQWTATGATTTVDCVDETAPNSDTDYISTASTGDISLFTYDSIPITSTLLAVVPIPFAKKTDAGTAKIKSVVRHSGTNYSGAEKAPSNGAYEYHPDILSVNPGTGVTWTASDWNAVEIGPERSA